MNNKIIGLKRPVRRGVSPAVSPSPPSEVPPEELWAETLVSSRLLEYEIWTRLHARRLGPTHGDAARLLVDRVALLELSPPVVRRAVDPFPTPLRTLAALHLAPIEFLRARGQDVHLAAYDGPMIAAARRLRIPLRLPAA